MIRRMPTVILDVELAQQLRDDRAARGLDKYDEVWDGTYMMAPAPNNEHQGILTGLVSILQETIGQPKRGKVFPGVNVSDRRQDWKENYRIPDVAVFMNDSQAVDCGSYWFGGPDLAIEILSHGDQAREKIAFYGSVATRELLIIDREPWQLELHQLAGETLELVATNRPDDSEPVSSEVTGLSFALQSVEASHRPMIVVAQAASGQSWAI